VVHGGGAMEPTALNYSALSIQLTEHEATRLRPYDDATGEELRPGDTLRGKITIGIGRNLSDRGISGAESHIFLANDIKGTVADLDRNLPNWRRLDEIRQRVLTDMVFNLGISRFLGFTRMLQALSQALAQGPQGDYARVGDEMKDSDWYRQVGKRGKRLVLMMDTGAPVALGDVRL